MFPLHCNKCFRRQKFEPHLVFHVSRCGHVICKQCLQQTCPICAKPYNGNVIQKEMPPAMAEYFEDPIKRYRHYQKVMKFHYDQERNLMEHLCSTDDDEDLKKFEDEIKGYHKLQQTLDEKVEHERKRVRKLKEYIAYHERRMEQARYMTPPITAQPRLRYPARSKNGSDTRAGTSATATFDCMPQLTQTVRAHYPPPRSPTLSTNNSSGSEVTLSQSFRNKSRTPPPLLPCSEHQNKSKHHLSFPKF